MCHAYLYEHLLTSCKLIRKLTSFMHIYVNFAGRPAARRRADASGIKTESVYKKNFPADGPNWVCQSVYKKTGQRPQMQAPKMIKMLRKH